MNFQNILLENEGQISTITINRPQSLNALNGATISELSEALSQLEQDSNCRVIIITGSGQKSFVAGADIKEFSDFGQHEAEELARNGQNLLFNKIENLKKPVIAAVNGFALGGGCELAMACTLRVAGADAKLGLPEVKLGLIPGAGGTQRLPRLVGRGAALDIMLTGRQVDTTEALRMGLIDRLVPAGSARSAARELATELCAASAPAQQAVVRTVDAAFDLPLADGLRYEVDQIQELFERGEAAEGLRAFVEKRRPNFG